MIKEFLNSKKGLAWWSVTIHATIGAAACVAFVGSIVASLIAHQSLLSNETLWLVFFNSTVGMFWGLDFGWLWYSRWARSRDRHVLQCSN